MVFIIPSARREVELRDENVAGYLATSPRLGVPPLPELRSPEDGPGPPDADQRQRRDVLRPAPATRCAQNSASDEMRSDQRRDLLRPAPATRCPQTSASDEMSREPEHVSEQTGCKLFVLCSFIVFSGEVRSCVACAYWSTVGNLARISLIGRE